MTNSFSKRYGYGQRKGALVFEDAPERVRVGLREVLTKVGFGGPKAQRGIICTALRRRPNPRNWSEYPNINQEVEDLIHGLEWYEFYDMCEKIAALDETREVGGLTSEYELVFESKLNQLFIEENIGYQMTNGKIDKLATEDFDKAVNGAIQALEDPKYAVVLGQFKKALGFRNSLPPDHSNAVKEAVNAVEGALQIATAKPSQALPTIVTNLQPQLPKHFERIVKELYGYGCAGQGMRHAGVGGPVPSTEEAEFVIHCAAATIRYIAAKY